MDKDAVIAMKLQQEAINEQLLAISDFYEKKTSNLQAQNDAILKAVVGEVGVPDKDGE